MSEPVAVTVRNPYPGLRPFRSDEKHLFFGREQQVDRMVEKLAAHHFLAIVGGSGSGKSSLVNCGLRPALHRGNMASGGAAWRMAQMRPGSDPIGALARALAVPGVLFDEPLTGALSTEALVESTLRLGSLGLIDMVEQADLPGSTRVLVVADQFEELFRFRGLGRGGHSDGFSAGEDAVAFVNLLLEAAAKTDVPIYVVLTMRSDFLGDCARFHGLPEAINQGQYLVPRLTRGEIRAAITGPAAVAGTTLSPVLITRLLNDLGDSPDQLSILQHSLHRTWARWEGTGGAGPLELEHYEAIGTMAHALDRHAEQAYAELGGDHQRRSCERIFKVLTDRGTDTRGIRRPMGLAKLCATVGASSAEVTEVIDVFREPSRSFLMPPLPEALEPDTVIDISHESLMRVWERLKAWTAEEAQSAQRYRRLSETAADHVTGKAALLRDPELQLSLDWQNAANPNAAWAGLYGGDFDTAIRFLAESEDAREKEKRETEDRQRRELEQARAFASERAKSARLLRIGFSFAVILAAVATGAFLLAVQAKKTAESATIVRGISQATTEFQSSPARGLLLAVEALNTSRRKELMCSPEIACVQAAAQSLVALLSQTGGIPLVGHTNEVLALSFSGDGKHLATAESREIRVWTIDAFSGAVANKVTVLRNPSQPAMSLSVSENGKLVASGSFGAVDLWSAEKEESRPHSLPPVPLGNFGSTLASFSANGRLLLTVTGGIARVWQLDRLETPTELNHPNVIAATLTSDGKSMLTVDVEGLVHLWRLDQIDRKRDPLLLASLTAPVAAASFSADGKYLLIPRQLNPGSLRSTARLVTLDNLTTWEEKPVSDASSMAPVPRRAASLSADGKLVATVDDGWTVRLWQAPNSETAVKLHGHEGPVRAVSLSPDGKFIATGGDDRTARLWRVDQPMAIASGDTSSNWTTRLDELVELARRTVGRNLTPEEWSQFFPGEDYRSTFSGISTPWLKKPE